MKHQEFCRATLGMASVDPGIGGRVSAHERNPGIQDGKEKTFGHLLCCAVLGAAAVLFPVQKTMGQDINKNVRFIPFVIVSSTVPANGDGNPYGVAFVPSGFPKDGLVKAGDLLVSNFNNSVPIQGTGTTIIKLTLNGQVEPAGSATVFFQGSPSLGLTTALGVLQRGFVLVGSVPTTGGTFATIQPGSLLILDKNANVVTTLTKANLLDSPWDLTIQDGGDAAKVFVSNVVSGTVTRLDLAIISGQLVVMGTTQIAKGYTVVPNTAAVILGPTGVAYDQENDVLFVASTADNEIFAVSNAGIRTAPPANGTGTVIFKNNHLRGPLALVLAPNGDLITSNGDAVNANVNEPSEIVEFTKRGQFIGQFNVDPGQGGAFGIAVEAPGEHRTRFAAVDDNTNDVSVYQLPNPREGGL
jgi:hypothetical protein